MIRWLLRVSGLLELGRAFVDLVNEIRYTRAAARWEGWGRAGDPRNDRPELTREQWEAGGYEPGPWRL